MSKTPPTIVIAGFIAAFAAAAVWRMPVNGWGSVAWMASAIAMTVIRTPFAQNTQSNVITEQRQTLTEKVLLGIVGLGLFYLPFVHLLTGFLSFANYSLPHSATALGAAALVPALWLFWRSHTDLGRNWSATVELREEHSLITSGVYERIRHPMYTAIFGLCLAQLLLLHNWITGPSGVIAFGLMYFVRVPYEEAMMREKFGPAYTDYCRRSGRLWPS